MSIDYTQGAFFPDDGLTLPYIWISLHLNAQMEQDILADARMSQETSRLAEEITFLLHTLKAVPASTWSDLCDASGWTVYGAIGLSWCMDATPEQFWSAWDRSGFAVSPAAPRLRPLDFIKPGLLPDIRRLSALFSESLGDLKHARVHLAMQRTVIEIDVDPAMLFAPGDVALDLLSTRVDLLSEEQ
jgi:hypothetical protein